MFQKGKMIETYNALLHHQRRGGRVFYGKRLVSRRYFHDWPAAQVKGEIDRGKLFEAVAA